YDCCCVLFSNHTKSVHDSTSIRKKVERMMIEVNDLHKYFGELEVLKGIDFNVEESEVVCVIGPSGSGKSTLLRCLNSLEEKTSGELIIDGDRIGDKHVNINEIRAEVGMVFQQFNLFPHKSVLENIML